MKKTKYKQKTLEKRTFSMLSALRNSAKFVWLYKRTFTLWCLANFVFLKLFTFIPNGWANSLSIVWLVAYYIFWCIYIRHIQRHPPYFSLIRIFNGLIPASKIMFINISLYFILVVLPYIPLFMGFRDNYLEFFEQYMYVMQSHNSLLGKICFSIFMILISPYTLSRPYLAWISSIIGKSRSIVDAYYRTHGNYWNFVLSGFTMSSIFAVFYYLDAQYQTTSLIYAISILTIYFNIVYLNIYKAFYKRKPRTKQSSE